MSKKVNWDRIREVFGRALEIHPDERPAFVRGQCGDDHELRERITSLLDAHEELEVGGISSKRLMPSAKHPRWRTGPAGVL